MEERRDIGIELPTELTKPDNLFIHQKFCMLGNPGIGKSDFWSQNVNALFIDTEGGLKYLTLNKIPKKEPARDWEDLREIYGLLIASVQNKTFKYDCIVVDTIDKVSEFAEEVIIERGRKYYKSIADDIHSVGDLPNGAGWGKHSQLVISFLDNLKQLPCAVAFISHIKEKNIKDGVREYHKKTITIGGQTGPNLLAWPDHILHLESHLIGDKLQRIVWTKPTQSREAESRGGVVPDGWRWTEDMKVNWDTFRKLFK